jgi:lysophospholipase L1-like esterase
MGVALYLLLSGDTLYVGLCLVVVGIVASRWRSVLGGVLVWAGLVLAMVSAVPLHPATYALLLILGAAWQVSRTRNHKVNQRTAAVLIVAVAIVFGWAFTHRGASRLTLPRDRAVFVIGDSLSAGLGTSKAGAWPQLLSARLKLQVSNLAWAGATLGDGVSQARAIPEGPAIVLVELGGNDLLAGAEPARFGADLRSLLATLVGTDRQVLMFELPLLPFQNAFGRIQREACAQYEVTLLSRSLLAGAVALPGHAGDGLHLSPKGHSWLADRVGEMWRRV